MLAATPDLDINVKQERKWRIISPYKEEVALSFQLPYDWLFVTTELDFDLLLLNYILCGLTELDDL